jgi:uncharacterized protein (TIGR03032 family)
MTQNSNTVCEVELEYSPDFPGILDQLQCSLLVSTYQAGKVISIGVHEDELQVSYLDFEEPMGIAVSNDQIAIGSNRQIHFIRPVHQILETQWPDGPFDGAFIAQSSIYTGRIHSHELAWGQDGLWIVNTLFSSLCTLRDGVSFVLRWQPPFIDSIGEHDCCHLNGLAMRDNTPGYVSMIAPTSKPSGWREHKRDGGCIVAIPSGETVCSGLSMPHSPRWYGDKLWILNSGRGELGYIDLNENRFVPVEFLPGFLRGVSFVGDYAFVGLSKARETNLFGGLPITERPDTLRCGIGIVDLRSGKTIAVLKFLTGVDEIFAVETVLGYRNSLFAGSQQNGRVREIWLI